MKTDTVVLIVLVILLMLAALLLVARPIVPPGPGAGIAWTTPFVTSGGNGMLDLYRMHVGHYPVSLQDLVARPANAADSAKWRGPYIKSSPTALADAWGTPYYYCYPGVNNPGSYDLWSAGPDGQSGTADDITNWPPVAPPATAPTTTRPTYGGSPPTSQP
jgi:general secretion pathway protein G